MDHEALASSPAPAPATDTQEGLVVFDANSDELIGFDTEKPVPAMSVDEMQVFPIEELLTKSDIVDPSQDSFLVEPIEPLGEAKQDMLLVQDGIVPTENVSSDRLVSSLSENIEDSSKPLENLHESAQNPSISATDAAVNFESTAQTIQFEEHQPVASRHEDLMPQEILKLSAEVLDGEWTLEKWEYWFRNSQLSPAVQELAQHGLMSGQIDGLCTFTIPQQYEGMLSQLQYALETEIKTMWPNTQFSVQYAEVSGITPFVKQAERKQKAFQRAEHLLKKDPVVKSLLETFQGELQNIQLKP